jgi:hypothetical protein
MCDGCSHTSSRQRPAPITSITAHRAAPEWGLVGNSLQVAPLFCPLLTGVPAASFPKPKYMIVMAAGHTSSRRECCAKVVSG